MALGQILEGPAEETMGPLVAQALPLLITALKDTDQRVRPKVTHFE